MAKCVMKEADILREGAESKSVKERYGHGKGYDCVITICYATEDEECSLFPGKAVRFNRIDFSDSDQFEGDDEERHKQAEELRDTFDKRITEFVRVVCFTE